MHTQTNMNHQTQTQIQHQRGIHITEASVAKAKELVAAAQVGYIEPGFPDLDKARELLACSESMIATELCYGSLARF